jgi:hypothetical protein
MSETPDFRLPDDIEQFLLDGQRMRATHDLMRRRGITLYEARELVERWLFERQQSKRREDPQDTTQ